MLDILTINTNSLLINSIDTIWNSLIMWISEYTIHFDSYYFNQFLYNTWINLFFTDWFMYFIKNINVNEKYNSFLMLNNTNYFKETIILLINQNILYYNLETINKEILIIKQLLATQHLSYNFILVWTILKYSLSIFIIFYIIVYNYYNINQLNNLQNSFLSKFLHTVESEEELGSLDDSFTVIFLFLIVFGWFFCLSLSYSFLFYSQLTLFGVGAVILISFILLTPFSTLIDFGVAFTTYIRGASSSSNLIVECVFDIIGTLVVFTRFVVQNIRFVLIFFAYFELFEWTYNSSLIKSLNEIFNFNNQNTSTILSNLGVLDTKSIFVYFATVIISIISYLYYLVHLLILVFVQVTIYLLISFWLFFFFYTSFTINKTEKLFLVKKLKYAC